MPKALVVFEITIGPSANGQKFQSRVKNFGEKQCQLGPDGRQEFLQIGQMLN